MSKWEENEEIQLFREYLRIPSVHPNIDYAPCVEFLRKISNDVGLKFQVEYPGQYPIVILTWVGAQPELKSVLLNSHMDVVPVFEEFWTHKPFAADIDSDGKIFARGSQDMKCVATQYLGAIRKLKSENVQLQRSIHVVFVPDEENFGPDGWGKFSKTKAFEDLNVGFALDEGIASPSDVYEVFYGERTCWHVIFHVFGQPGHGSMLLKETAAEKLHRLLDRIYDYRRSQEVILEGNPDLLLGDITTFNVTKIEGGKQRNVLPPVFDVTVDIRIALTQDLEELEGLLKRWAKESGEGIEIEFAVKQKFCVPTKTDGSNKFWNAMKQAIDEMEMKTKLQVFPAGTDAAYLRELEIPAIGFSPMINTPVLLHDHDEYLHADVYLKGIEIYTKIIKNLGNVEN